MKRSLKRFVDVIYSITEFKRKVFVLSVKALPLSRKWLNVSAFKDREFGLIILTFCRRNYLSF